MKQETVSKLIRTHYPLDKDIQRLISLCTFDLYFGPLGDTDDDGQPWPGFCASLDLIKQGLPDISDLWIDVQCDEVYETEPEGHEEDGEWYEPFWEDWYSVDMQEVLNILVGKELAKYL